MSLIKRTIAALPDRWQFELESQLRSWQLRRGRFDAGEPEYDLLPDLVNPGDWALDIGANIGHYTLELARLVGPTGRVIALEPVMRPFAQVAGLIARTGLHNVTLLNVAASDSSGIAAMNIPSTRDGLPLFYESRIQEKGTTRVVTTRIDDLTFLERVALAKIDVEGHEIAVLNGMQDLIRRDRPVLIVENSSAGIADTVEPRGYERERLANSPNLVFRPLRD